MILRYWHTLRHLRPGQVLHRVAFRLSRPRADLAPPPQIRPRAGPWQPPPPHPRAMLPTGTFRFLGEEHTLRAALDWNAPGRDRLWLYHLHYFQDLAARADDGSREALSALISRWLDENPPTRGVGWEPYPLSRRIVNWVKWALAGESLDTRAVHSLAVQARYLRRRLERHLLGNHLLANAKALAFAGLYFTGDEPEGWFDVASRLIEEQIADQVLADGGHVEGSPMYHALVLEDLLDLANLFAAFGRPYPVAWREAVQRMGRWLHALCHPDGGIALFGDSTLDGALSAADLDTYADALGIAAPPPARTGLLHLVDSGYVRAQQPRAVALLDVGPVGPDWLPAHGHADTLTFELSVHGTRLVVDPGVSTYRAGPLRSAQRGTAAHNTLTVDGADSSEMWGEFRVARRARILEVEAQDNGGDRTVQAAHDGFRRCAGVHRRRWRLAPDCMDIEDSVTGRGRHTLAVRLLLHPEVSVAEASAGTFALADPRHARPVRVRFRPPFTARVEEATWHPRFGVSLPARALAGMWEGELPITLRHVIEWEV